MDADTSKRGNLPPTKNSPIGSNETAGSFPFIARCSSPTEIERSRERIGLNLSAPGPTRKRKVLGRLSSPVATPSPTTHISNRMHSINLDKSPMTADPFRQPALDTPEDSPSHSNKVDSERMDTQATQPKAQSPPLIPDVGTNVEVITGGGSGSCESDPILQRPEHASFMKRTISEEEEEIEDGDNGYHKVPRIVSTERASSPGNSIRVPTIMNAHRRKHGVRRSSPTASPTSELSPRVPSPSSSSPSPQPQPKSSGFMINDILRGSTSGNGSQSNTTSPQHKTVSAIPATYIHPPSAMLILPQVYFPHPPQVPAMTASFKGGPDDHPDSTPNLKTTNTAAILPSSSSSLNQSKTISSSVASQPQHFNRLYAEDSAMKEPEPLVAATSESTTEEERTRENEREGRQNALLQVSEAHLAILPDEDGDTPLHLSIIHENLALTFYLVRLIVGVSMNLDIANNLRQTPLHLAIITKQPAAVRLLTQAGASVNYPDRRGNTSLHLASQRKDMNILHILSQANNSSPDFNARNFAGLTPVHVATKVGSIDVLKFLFQAGAHKNVPDTSSGRTPLHYAVEQENFTLCNFLLESNCNVNCTTFSGNTPLHIAAGRKLKEIVALLMAYGANPAIANGEGDFPSDLPASLLMQRAKMNAH